MRPVYLMVGRISVLGGIVAILLLAVLTFEAYRAARGALASRTSILEARKVVFESAALSAAYSEAISATRGYLITGQSEFLEDHRAAVTRLRNQLSIARSGGTGEVVGRARFHRLLTLIETRIGILEQDVTARDQRGPDETGPLQMSAAGREIDLEIQGVVSQIREREGQVIASRLEDSRDYLTRVFAVLGGTLLAAFILVAVAYSGWRHSLRASVAAAEYAEKTVDSVQTPLLVLSADLRVVSGNRAFHEHFGTEANVVADRYVGILSGGILSAPNLIEQLKQVSDGGTSFDGLRFKVLRNGRLETYEAGARLFGQLVSGKRLVLLSLRDVTQLEENTTELVKSRTMFQRLFDDSPDALILLDSRRRIVRHNTRALAMFRLSSDEMAARSLEELLPERFRARQQMLFKTFFDTARVPSPDEPVRLTGRRSDGSEFPLEMLFSPLEANGGLNILAVVRDITDRVEAQTRIEQLNQDLQNRATQLEHANQELESFSYSVSHDLRAPLRHITGFSEMLKVHAEKSLDSKGLRYVDTIIESGRKMGCLIDDLLTFSRVGRAQFNPKPVSLDSLVTEVRASLQRDAGDRNIRWEVHPLPEVLGDLATLRQVVYNLLANAIKYTRQRAEALVEVGTVQSPPGEVVCFVRDNGAGFDMKYKDKLFGVFQRLHGPLEFEGTGVGLAIVRRVIQRHGGRVWAEGEVGRGATFYFSLPTGATV